jgi:ATP synthase protein I
MASKDRPKRRKPSRSESARSIGFYTLIPTMMGVGPALGFFLGTWLERRFGHAPWLSFGCVVLGGVASVRQVVLLLKRAGESEAGDSSRKDDSPPNGP